MKKYLGLILSAVILLSSIAVNAETNTPKTTEEAVMSVELIENNALEEDIQEREIDKSNINSDESQDIPYFDTFTIYLSDIVPSFVVFSAFNITGPGSG